jgi:hypothetical protein
MAFLYQPPQAPYSGTENGSANNVYCNQIVAADFISGPGRVYAPGAADTEGVFFDTSTVTKASPDMLLNEVFTTAGVLASETTSAAGSGMTFQFQTQAVPSLTITTNTGNTANFALASYPVVVGASGNATNTYSGTGSGMTISMTTKATPTSDSVVSVTIVNPGSGYLATETITITQAQMRQLTGLTDITMVTSVVITIGLNSGTIGNINSMILANPGNGKYVKGETLTYDLSNDSTSTVGLAYIGLIGSLGTAWGATCAFGAANVVVTLAGKVTSGLANISTTVNVGETGWQFSLGDVGGTTQLITIVIPDNGIADDDFADNEYNIVTNLTGGVAETATTSIGSMTASVSHDSTSSTERLTLRRDAGNATSLLTADCSVRLVKRNLKLVA